MINDILEYYNIKGELKNIEQNNSGNINKTYVVTFTDDGEDQKYLIQKINTNVFPEPYKLMKNIDSVTTYLKNAIEMENDTKHKTLEIVKTKEDDLLCVVTNNRGEKEYFRMYKYINNAIAYDQSTNKEVVYNTGKAFGNFQRLLSNYPMEELTETIKDFHNTMARYRRFFEDIKIDPRKRALDVAKEIVFILQREDAYSMIMNKLGKDIPLRVTHNDTKVNNVMMSKESNDFLAVIDLDTVMPGSLLFDYGDGIRSTASTAKEDELDLTKVHLDMNLFKAYTDGYMSEMAEYLKNAELLLMAESIRIITLELAMRFLNDYINGDTYFKVDENRPKHNLERARNQIALVKDIEAKMPKLKKYIEQSYSEHRQFRR